MRKLFVGGALACALLLNLVGALAAAAPTNFAGAWSLDKSKSKDLPQQWSNIEMMTLRVTQDGQQVSVSTDVQMSADANASGGMGGGRGRGMGMFPQNASYKLDGT